MGERSLGAGFGALVWVFQERLPGGGVPLSPNGIGAVGPVDVYVRPGDLRLAEPGGPGVRVRVEDVQRTQPRDLWPVTRTYTVRNWDAVSRELGQGSG